MRFRWSPQTTLIMIAVAGTAALAADSGEQNKTHKVVAGPIVEAPFLSENAAAMNKMMSDMNVKPTGDVDADFVAVMIPHHQGAIDMAQAVLRFGKNEQIRRIAQEIVVEQQQEITAMRLALGQPLPASVPSPTQPGLKIGG